MTKSELENLGFLYVGSKRYPKRYFVPTIGEIDIDESTTIADLLTIAWDKGNHFGKEQGAAMKLQQIQTVLGLINNE